MVLLLTLSAFVMSASAGFCCQGSHWGDASRCIMNDGVTHADERAFMQSEKRAAKIWGGKLAGTVGGKTVAEKTGRLLKCCRVVSCCHTSVGSIEHAPDGPHITVHCSQRQADGSYLPWTHSRHINCVTGAAMGGGYRRLEDQIEAELFTNNLPQQADQLGQLVAPLEISRRRRRNISAATMENGKGETYLQPPRQNSRNPVVETGAGGCVGGQRQGDWCQCQDGYTSALNWDTGSFLGGHREKYHVDNIGLPNFGCFPDVSQLWEMMQGGFVIAQEALDPKCMKRPPVPVPAPVADPTQPPRERERERDRVRFQDPPVYVDPEVQKLKTQAAITGATIVGGFAAYAIFNVVKCGVGLIALPGVGGLLCIPIGRRLEISDWVSPSQVLDYLQETQDGTSTLELNGMLMNMMELPTAEVVAEENYVLEQLYAFVPVSEETKSMITEWMSAFYALAEKDIDLATAAIQAMPPWTIWDLVAAARTNPDPIDG